MKRNLIVNKYNEPYVIIIGGCKVTIPPLSAIDVPGISYVVAQVNDTTNYSGHCAGNQIKRGESIDFIVGKHEIERLTDFELRNQMTDEEWRKLRGHMAPLSLGFPDH